MRLSEAARYCHGVVQGADVEFLRVSTDTRAIESGDLFVALRGERFDGHQFIEVAAAAGAVAAMVERADVRIPSLVVEDTRKALGLLASGWAGQVSMKRIAVTGNAGKTTVKEMLACMLSSDATDPVVHATRGNLNNDVGVPLTLLAVQPSHRYGVFELGANAPGEIAWTSSLVKADVVMVTNVTGAHLAGFGSMQGIAEAKAEIFTGAAPNAIAIINLDDSFADFFAEQAKAAGLKLISTGRAEDAQWRALDIRDLGETVSFVLQVENRRYPVLVPLPGVHQVSNALMALAAVVASGVEIDVAISRLVGMRPVKGRMNISRCLGGTLVDDSYNANPGSVRAAIDWLSLQSGPQALVLGDIGELGAEAAALHRQLGVYARQAGLTTLIALGELATQAADAFGEGGSSADSHAEAADKAHLILAQHGTVLVKGSRSAGMDAVVTALQAKGEMH